MKKFAGVIMSIMLTSLTFNATGHSLSKEECTEASDFIKNAALARENGMSGITFIGKILADFVTIKSFPPEFRWFVRDEEDEDFLLKSATQVFEHPEDPDVHQRNFLGECLIRTSS